MNRHLNVLLLIVRAGRTWPAAIEIARVQPAFRQLAAETEDEAERV